MIKRVYIEITNQCNLKCSFCKKNKRKIVYLTTDKFSYILNEIKPFCNYIYLHVQGEPLMHPELKKFVEIANEKNFFVQITTNGSLIDKNSFLIDNIRKISFSLHSIPFQTIDPLIYLENILSFCKKCKSTYCELRFYNEKNMDLKSKGLLTHLEKSYNFKTTAKNKSYQIMPNVYVAFDNIFTWPSLNNPFVSDEGFCYGAHNMIAILSNGDVSACCLDSEGDINFGNIYEMPLKDILQNKRYLKVVEGFHNKKAVEQLCKHCSYRLKFNR